MKFESLSIYLNFQPKKKGLIKNLCHLRISKKNTNNNVITSNEKNHKFSKEEEFQFEALRATRTRRGAFYDGENSSLYESSSGLAKPSKGYQNKINDESAKIRSESERFEIGYADTKGKRLTMEDQIIILGHFRGNPKEDYLAIFDGHGGTDASIFAANNLHHILSDQLSQNPDPILSLKNSFLQTHDKMKEKNIKGGTTSLVAYFTETQAYLANAGDSRAVFCLDGKPVRWSIDHKPNIPSEKKRIEDLGGQVTMHEDKLVGTTLYRVNAQLAVSRSLGDFNLEPYVIPEPDVFGPISLNPNQMPFLILACDGNFVFLKIYGNDKLFLF